MTTYSIISNPAVAVGGIPSSVTVTALRDNPIAMAEAAPGAPINAMGWHPVDKVTVGDGKRGIIYDFAVSGAVSSVISPDFVDGYEYRMIGVELLPSSAATMSFDFYHETSAAYITAHTTGSSGVERNFDFEISMPRLSKFDHVARFWTSAGALATQSSIGTSTTPRQKLLRARIRFNGGANINAGQVYFFRRREFASGD